MFGDFLDCIAAASNLNSGVNPDYAKSDFLNDFPQFTSSCTTADGQTPAIPDVLLQKFINMANASISFSRYAENWSYCMGLYVAHFCTLFLSASSGENPSASASPALMVSSKSVGDVSVSYDVNSIADDLKGYGTFKSTTYGQQLATFARLAGMGGMTVW